MTSLADIYHAVHLPASTTPPQAPPPTVPINPLSYAVHDAVAPPPTTAANFGGSLHAALSDLYTQARQHASLVSAAQRPLPAPSGTAGIFGGGNPAGGQMAAPIAPAPSPTAGLQRMPSNYAARTTPQQQALQDGVRQYIAAQQAAKLAAQQAAYAKSPQAMIDNRGVFAGRQQAAAQPTSGPQQLPQLQTTRGLPPMGGV